MSVATERSNAWRWWVCGLLLLATTINYMDRQTLSQLKLEIEKHLELTPEQDYGFIEAGFGLAFALGSFVFGILVDRWNVYWVYPLALLGWSIVGFLTGFAEGFWSLLAFRLMLGFFEGSNWPCALRTTQRILSPDKRSMGNGILQSGAAVGAILVPQIVLLLTDEARPETWRLPVFVVGAVGAAWVVLWWLSLRPADLAHPPEPADPVAAQVTRPGLPRDVFLRRFCVLIVLVVTVNMTWHFLRAWHPSYLRTELGVTKVTTNHFSTAYYAFTDLGALTAGALSMWLVARSWATVHNSRRLVFFGMAALVLLCLLIPALTNKWLVMGTLLVIGYGALGVFPCYYSFSQDLTTRNQGKVTGSLGACCWIAMAGWQAGIGLIVARTGSYAIPFVIAGLAPILGFVVLLLFWGKVEEVPAAPPVEEPAVDRPAEAEAGVMLPTGVQQ